MHDMLVDHAVCVCVSVCVCECVCARVCSACVAEPVAMPPPTKCRTPLHYAARNGHLQVCRLLVRAGVAADCLTHDSTPPLHLAVWKGRLDAAEYLLSVCDNLHSVNDYGYRGRMDGWMHACACVYVCYSHTRTLPDSHTH